MVASHETLRRRILERGRRGDDASEADLQVLEEQMRTAEPLTAEEWPLASRYDAELDRLDLTLMRIGQLQLRRPVAA